MISGQSYAFVEINKNHPFSPLKISIALYQMEHDPSKAVLVAQCVRRKLCLSVFYISDVVSKELRGVQEFPDDFGVISVSRK